MKSSRPLTFAVVMVLAAASAGPLDARQSDLDAFMARVIARRDENWKKMQQYILDEQERFRLTGPDGARIYGFDRKYTWFIRDGVFIRSPLEVDGVKLGESERASAEADWIRRERRRDERQKQREKEREKERAAGGAEPDAPPEPPPPDPDAAQPAPSSVEDMARASLEPRFVSAAYFLRFKFDPGHYALAGRERLNDRDVLKIEYYPSKLFNEGRTRPNRRLRDKDAEIDEKMNKVSLVTLWIDPKEHQILQYTFDNVDLEFLPGRSLVRVDDLRASMKMGQPFPGVWLPASIDMDFGFTLALGTVAARYEVQYRDYRLAEVTTRIKP